VRRYRCTASSLKLRAAPDGEDTGARLTRDQVVPAYGQSFDAEWIFVSAAKTVGWASASYLEPLDATPTPPTPPEAPISAPALADAVAMSPETAKLWLPYVLESARRFGFEKPARMAMWLAQCGHESQGFSRLEENLNYSAAALRKTWPSRFPSDEAAQRYARQPEKIANYVYASRMGNGDEASGDGWAYRGRGLIQITGKDNYRECSKVLGEDFVRAPDLLELPRYAALSAGWFWHSRGLNQLADGGEIELVTKRINGSLNGLADRKRRWERAKKTLGIVALGGAQ
jgi:putative chitinase